MQLSFMALFIIIYFRLLKKFSKLLEVNIWIIIFFILCLSGNLNEIGYSCNAGDSLINGKCYRPCSYGYSAAASSTTCYQDCAFLETSVDTYTCRKPQVDDKQFQCALGCSGSQINCGNAAWRCVNDGYRFPSYRCHCRFDAVNYKRATMDRTWYCPAGTLKSQGSCVPCSAGNFNLNGATLWD
jgi:hypothetical protein